MWREVGKREAGRVYVPEITNLQIGVVSAHLFEATSPQNGEQKANWKWKLMGLVYGQLLMFRKRQLQ